MSREAQQGGGMARPVRRAKVRLGLLHGVGLTFFVGCALALPELRGSALGVALWIGILGAVVLLAGGMVARRGRAAPARPVFSVHTWLGLLMLGVGAFGVVEAWNSELPGVLVMLPRIGAPVSRQFFIIAGVFGGASLYGALAVALGSGLAIRHPPN